MTDAGRPGVGDGGPRARAGLHWAHSALSVQLGVKLRGRARAAKTDEFYANRRSMRHHGQNSRAASVLPWAKTPHSVTACKTPIAMHAMSAPPPAYRSAPGTYMSHTPVYGATGARLNAPPGSGPPVAYVTAMPMPAVRPHAPCHWHALPAHEATARPRTPVSVSARHQPACRRSSRMHVGTTPTRAGWPRFAGLGALGTTALGRAVLAATAARGAAHGRGHGPK